MSMNNLTKDGEFRYIVQWFNEWSELQRDDFVPVLVEYVTKDATTDATGANGVYMNGIINSVTNASLTDKPMSLFQCRVKLFRQWTPKWPEEFKQKLREKIIEIDPKVGEKIINEIKGLNGSHLNGNDIGNGNGYGIDSGEENDPVMAELNNDVLLNTALSIVEETEEAINADNRLAGLLNNNETPQIAASASVADNIPQAVASTVSAVDVVAATSGYAGGDDAVLIVDNDTQAQTELAEQVQIPIVEHDAVATDIDIETDTDAVSVVVTANAIVPQTVSNNAEVPYVA